MWQKARYVRYDREPVYRMPDTFFVRVEPPHEATYFGNFRDGVRTRKGLRYSTNVVGMCVCEEYEKRFTADAARVELLPEFSDKQPGKQYATRNDELARRAVAWREEVFGKGCHSR